MIEQKKINFQKLNGLVPAIVVDNNNNSVLMLGFMNEESVKKTIETKLVTFFSRSRNTLWTKGESSGNYLELVDIRLDCDNDALLVYTNPKGNTCHTGNYSCFDIMPGDQNFLSELFELILSRKKNLPEKSYTTQLFREGSDRIIQKVGEEAVETIIAAKNRNKSEIINESSDLIFHLLVMLAEQEIDFNEIISNLEQRHKIKTASQ